MSRSEIGCGLRRLVATGVLGLALIASLVAGCAKKRILAVDNLPPETTLFVSGALDTVNHVAHLYWFGSDPDGDVRGFELRFKNPVAPEDTDWVFTSHTDSVFTIVAPAGYTMPVFEVRAVDDRGARDPSPARQDFQFSNEAPTVRFINRLTTIDTTFASATLDWTATDVDGDEAALAFLVGLDTVPAALHRVTGRRLTVDTTDFKLGGVYPPTQPRMAFIRAIDDGGRASGWDSVRWVVRSPSTLDQHPRLLLVDDVPYEGGGSEGNPIVDSLWANTAARNLPAGSYSILRLYPRQPFRAAKDLAQTCKLFDAVVWYRDFRTSQNTPLRDYQGALATYLDGGGKLLVEGLDLIDGEAGPGLLSGDWTSRYFGSSDLIRSPRSGRSDSTVSWSITPGYYDESTGITNFVYLTSAMFDEVLQNGPNLNGLRGFAVRDTHFVALWARDSSLSPRVDRDIPVAVSVPVPESPPGAGRAIAFTIPVRAMRVSFVVPRLLAKVFQQMGLTSP
jgi:hypothetical protein